jgi:toxin FitB
MLFLPQRKIRTLPPRGIERLDHGARRERLQRWLRWDVRVRFEGRTLPVDAEVAEVWGVIVAKASREGITLNPMDAFLAATAQCRGLVIATRNTE